MAFSYHDLISDAVYFQLHVLDNKILGWHRLILWVFIQEMLICLPIIYPLALIFGRHATIAALLICLPNVSAFFFKAYYAETIIRTVFFLYLVLCHSSLLLIGVWITQQSLNNLNHFLNIKKAQIKYLWHRIASPT